MKSQGLPGITLRSFAACLSGMLAAALFIQFGSVTMKAAPDIANHALAIPALVVFLALTLVSGALYACRRWRLLSRAETLCVFFSMMIATPIMSMGFWHTAISVTTTLPRAGDFAKLDGMSETLWPHGPNLIPGALEKKNEAGLRTAGGFSWREEDLAGFGSSAIATLRNTNKGERSIVRILVPLLVHDKPHVFLREPYMLSVLARAKDLGPGATYYCRIYYDGATAFEKELFASRQEGKRTYAQKDGFVRLGYYALEFDTRVREQVVLEFGLSGAGEVQFRDAKLMSVGAMQRAFSGMKAVTQSEYDRTPENQRRGLAPMPDRYLSLKGLKWLLRGYVPFEEWLGPTLAWCVFVGLVLAALFAVAAIMRRQWVESERYPLPLARIPAALLGEGEGDEGALPAIWKKPVMWAGFALSLLWCLMRGWRAFNPDVPDMNLSVSLNPYFDDPSWGSMWAMTFTVNAMFLSLAMFMELNVLLSLAVGYFLFRAQFWVGETTGWSANPDYPFQHHQAIGAYLAYSTLVLVLTRKHLWTSVREAWRGGWAPAEGEAMSYRTAYVVILAAFAGVAVWAHFLGARPVGILLLFTYLMLIGFASAKIRTECGTPYSGFTPYKSILIIPLLGGMTVFGPAGIIIAILVTFCFCQNAFFNIPGMQLEMIELGRRFSVRPRHLALTYLIGIAGGFFIGGWVFLANTYAIGGGQMRNADPYKERRYYFGHYTKAMNKATGDYFGTKEDQGEAAPESHAAAWAYAFGAAVTAALTILRQLFAGFWFHPVGFIVGFSFMAEGIWGSVLTAWLIRSIVLKFGGAATVREKLLPFFTGVFLAAVASYVVFFCINGYMYFFHPGVEPQAVMF